MSLADLPTELVAIVVDELDLGTIKGLSLVASSFRDPAQRHLFRHVKLYQEPHPTLCPDGTVVGSFRKVLNNPRIIPHIRHLAIRLPPKNVDEDEVALAGILTAVQPRLQRLSLVGSSRRWASHSQLLTAALLATMTAERLDALDIHGIHRLPVHAVYAALARVKELSISSCSIYPDGSGDYSGTLSSVEHLHLQYMPRDSVEQLICRGSPTLGRLSKVTLHMILQEFKADVRTYPFLIAIGRTLQELDLECEELWTVLRLPHLPHLRALTLRIDIGRSLCMPNTFPETLRNLPAVALRVICDYQEYTRQQPWPCLQRPFPSTQYAVDLNATRFLLEYSHRKKYDKKFEMFCQRTRLALPEYQPIFERA
ncbi:hypothetical protein C8F01DRAFT_1369254 [Mycena amicta]|nr:hypothetical protein C8F01DRAFT_1369254 [Mycena amicta]